MRWLLLCAYLGCLCFWVFRIRRRENEKNEVTGEFLALLRRVRREIACFARPLPEICRAADLPALRAAGFFDRLDAGDPLFAFRSSLPALSLSPDAAALLDGFFAGAGAPSREEELAGCDRVIAELGELAAREKSDGAVRVRLHTTLTLTGGLLFLLLLL